jgi:hypothetical protein
MRSFVFAAVVYSMTLGAAAASPAREWYILDFSSGQCRTAASIMPRGASTPEAMHNGLRAEHVVDAVHVEKAPDGNVLYVTISMAKEGRDLQVMFFPNKGLCDVSRMILIDAGSIPNSDDLR